MGQQGGVLRSYASLISIFTRILDVLTVLTAGVLCYSERFFVEPTDIPPSYGALILIGGLLVSTIFPLSGVYHSWRARGLFAPAVRTLFSWFLCLLLIFALLVLSKQGEHFSRLWLLFWATSSAVLLVSIRILVYTVLRSLRKRGFNRRNVVVIGSGPGAQRLVSTLSGAEWTGFYLLGVFDGDGERFCGANQCFKLSELDAFVEANHVDEAWVALPLERADTLQSVMENLRHNTVNVRYLPDFFGLFLLNHGVTEIMGQPMIDLATSPMEGANRVIKAVEDRVLSAIILVLISPVMLLIALGVKLGSPGPVFFKQKRHGWSQKEIVVYKFRSMKLHSEDDGEVTQAQRGDSRITPFGRFLRRTSLDELPQFINVLQGRMSIVGPRPHAIEHNHMYKELIENYMLRHKVKPGITGWAQVNGLRGETDTVEKMQRRIEYDLYYIENWSLLFDLKIIFLTVFKGFVHENAY